MAQQLRIRKSMLVIHFVQLGQKMLESLKCKYISPVIIKIIIFMYIYIILYKLFYIIFLNIQ